WSTPRCRSCRTSPRPSARWLLKNLEPRRNVTGALRCSPCARAGSPLPPAPPIPSFPRAGSEHMDVREQINATILRNQPAKLSPEALAAALAAADASRDRSLEGRRLAVACELSDCWPMSVCGEVARVLLPGPE